MPIGVGVKHYRFTDAHIFLSSYPSLQKMKGFVSVYRCEFVYGVLEYYASILPESCFMHFQFAQWSFGSVLKTFVISSCWIYGYQKIGIIFWTNMRFAGSNFKFFISHLAQR